MSSLTSFTLCPQNRRGSLLESFESKGQGTRKVLNELLLPRHGMDKLQEKMGAQRENRFSTDTFIRILLNYPVRRENGAHPYLGYPSL